jgi:hypothetical protein
MTALLMRAVVVFLIILVAQRNGDFAAQAKIKRERTFLLRERADSDGEERE